MTELELIKALRLILPSGWKVEPGNTSHVEVWCYPPKGGPNDEGTIAVSHSDQWGHSNPQKEWYVEMCLWRDDGDYEEFIWADTLEEALEFVLDKLPSS